MQSLGFSPLNSLGSAKATPKIQKEISRDPLSSLKLLSLKFKPCYSTRFYRNSSIQMSGSNEEEDLTKQMKEMNAAKKRWDALIREEKVKSLTPREAGYAIQLSYKTLLDVRPSFERNKAWVKGSTWIPIFDVDSKLDAGALSKKVTNFLLGGWWSGIPTLSYENQFISRVEQQFPKDTDLIVACQKGLRSLAACELLYKAGYENIFWVQGGLEAAEEEDFDREGPQPFKFAGIGGVSEFLGWTDQQRAAAAKDGWGSRVIYSARLIGLFILADGLFIGVQQLTHYLQEIRSS
ncbi:hypothetical protein C5167_017382 [Papaver somniferum]|uniref:Rhodanese domain-containing protein n=1 Tax=Papaver somniferum TaxID=3469 RepID=A0A4Y7IJ92_PAPSO|nr:rhodanese-like domain-containing protein 11, chloroplastic isoform X1 [Papaver somniferum]RZC48957.1 hypothetical protein C5167_017382 [Papaver somniferum]